MTPYCDVNCSLIAGFLTTYRKESVRFTYENAPAQHAFDNTHLARDVHECSAIMASQTGNWILKQVQEVLENCSSNSPFATCG